MSNATQTNIIEIKPRTCTTKTAAAYIGIPEATLKKSRSTGLLFGRPTPVYKKSANGVLYEFSVLDKWIDDMPQYENASDEHVQKMYS